MNITHAATVKRANDIALILNIDSGVNSDGFY